MTLKLVALTSLNGSDPMPMALGQKVVRLQLIDTSAKQVPGKPYLFKDDHGRLSYLPPEPEGKKAQVPAKAPRISMFGAMHGESLESVGLKGAFFDAVINMGAKGLMPDHPGWYAYDLSGARLLEGKHGKPIEHYLKFRYWDGCNWSVYAFLVDSLPTVARVKATQGDSISCEWLNLEMVFPSNSAEAKKLGLA